MALTEQEKRMVGGSDVAAIVGVSPYGSAYSVWERIVNGVERRDGPALSRGRRLEPVVLDWYAEQTGREVSRGMAWLTGDGRLRASLDAVSRERMREWDRVVEAKTAGAGEAHRWGEEETDAIPAEYLCQTQWYMGLTRRERTDVPALIAGDFRLYVVGFDADVYGVIREAVDRFWVDHVLARKPPDPTALPNDAEALQRRFKRHETSEHLDFSALSATAQATLEEYVRAYVAYVEAKKNKALWEARAKLVVSGAPGVARLPEATGFTRIDWESHGDGKVPWKKVAEALAKQHGVSPKQLQALAAENTGEPARPFTPRPVMKGRR